MYNTIRWDFCSQFSDKMSAGFTTRDQGASQKPFDSFNLALHCGDNPEDVMDNRKKLCESVNSETKSFSCAVQKHGTIPLFFHSENKGEGSTPQSPVREGDILLTRTPEILITIFTADCFPVFIYDPKANGGALIHAGWKGIAHNIIPKAIDLIKQKWGSDISGLYAGIGPGIGACCFYVDKDVTEQLKMACSKEEFYRKIENKWTVSLSGIVIEQLIKSGVQPKRIEKKTPCTSCDSRFFSYRAEKGTTGRMGAFFIAR